MKKSILLLVFVLIAVLLSFSYTAASAEPNALIECTIDIVYDQFDDGIYWYGPVHGCSLKGYLKFDADEERPSYFKGNTLNFFENFTIYPEDGGEIYGENAGVGHFYKKFKFRANGWVTCTSPAWTHLVGFKFFEMGTSNNPADGLPGLAPGTLMRLFPANRPFSP